MALTRKFLKALEIEGDKAEQIIEAHAETLEGLKTSLEGAQIPNPPAARYRRKHGTFQKGRIGMAAKENLATDTLQSIKMPVSMGGGAASGACADPGGQSPGPRCEIMEREVLEQEVLEQEVLEQVLRHIKNWFVLPGGAHPGRYQVRGGEIQLDFLARGQYFRILGSVFNDGLYRWGPDMPLLEDEEFSGAVWALGVPKEVLALAGEIAAWREKYRETAESPYASESFGGYSYSKGEAGEKGWQGVFRARLNPYRKLREIG